MIGLFKDVRYALRQFSKNVGFTTVAVLTLALGIGANTAIFSVVNAVLLHPLPYPESDRIVQLSAYYQGELQYSNFTAREFDFLKESSEPFEFLAARTEVGFNLTGTAQPVRIRALRVSSTYFNTFGVQPFLGRNFSKEEDSPGGPNVAVLSYGVWMSHFGGEPALIGKSVFLDGTPFTVIGVLPRSFQSIPAADLWTTIAQANATIGSGQNYTLLARLRTDILPEQADKYLQLKQRSFFQQFRPTTFAAHREATQLRAMPLVSVISADHRTPLIVLLGATGFVLLIACFNLANLLLARASTRRREFALRLAFGAKRSRLLSQVLTESLVLATIGGLLSVPIAHAALNGLLALAPADLPRAREIALDWFGLAFTAAVALGCGILFGIAPAFVSSRLNLNECLKANAGRVLPSLSRQPLRTGLVVLEVALSLVLLVGASLLIQTFANLLRADIGFDPRKVLAVQIWPAGKEFQTTDEMANFHRAIIERIGTIPGAESAAIVSGGLPLEEGGNLYAEFVGNQQTVGDSVDYREITPEYFRVLGVSLIQGRFFSSWDSARSAKVAIVNREMAQRYFPSSNPVGQYVKTGNLTWEIVGVVGSVKSVISEPAPATFFVPDSQAQIANTRDFLGWFPAYVLVRTAQAPLALDRQVVSAIRGANAEVPIGHVESLEGVLSTSIAFQQFLMILMAAFALLALVLAMLGIYGVIAYFVAQHTPEIGVRMALGSSRSGILQFVLRRGMMLVGGGIVAGFVGAFVLTRFLAAQLYGVKPNDPRSFALVVLALWAVALGACYLPARRAAQVDPNVALRYE